MSLTSLLAQKTVGCLENNKVDDFLLAMKYSSNQRKLRWNTIIIYEVR